MVAANRKLHIAKQPAPTKRKPRPPRKRKAELIAPACREDCQINHTITQTAAILQVSESQVRQLIASGILPVINCGLGQINKLRRIPHTAIKIMQQRESQG